MNLQKSIIYPPKEFLFERPKKIIELCNTITPIMNDLFGLDYSSRFWLIVLGNYIKTCVNRENLFQQEKFLEKPFFLPVNSFGAITYKKRLQKTLEYFGRGIKIGKSRKLFFECIKNNNNICIGSRGLEMSLNGIGNLCPEYYPKNFLFKDRGVRKRLNKIALSQENHFFRNLLHHVPEYYVEYFLSLLSKIPLHNPEKKIFHYEHIGSPFTEITIAKYIENGSQLYGYQTGGFVGELSYSPNQVLYEKVDKFITYGWKINAKDFPGKAFRLEEYRKKWLKEKKIIDEPEYDLLVIFSVINDQSRDYYKYFSDYFVSHVDRSRFPNIIFRPRPLTKYLNNTKELKFLNLPKWITIDDGKCSMAQIAASTKVIIQASLPSTNFLECIYAEQPVLAINTNPFPSDIAKPYYENFEKLKVLHKDLPSLLTHLNSINIDKWWQSVLENKNFKEFQELFTSKRC